jgi:hypothetical protein
MVEAWQPSENDESSTDVEPIPADTDGPRFTLAELADQEAMGYRAWSNSVGRNYRHVASG